MIGMTWSGLVLVVSCGVVCRVIFVVVVIYEQVCLIQIIFKMCDSAHGVEWSGPSSKVNEGKRSSILNCDNSVREESETKWDVNEMERESFFRAGVTNG